MSDSKNEVIEEIVLDDVPFAEQPQAGLAPEVIEVDQDSVKLVKIQAVVLDYKAAKMDISWLRLVGENVVPIMSGEEVIGTATLSLDKDSAQLVAEGTINYSTPERLSLENGDKLYLVLNGFHNLAERQLAGRLTAVEELHVKDLKMQISHPVPGATPVIVLK